MNTTTAARLSPAQSIAVVAILTALDCEAGNDNAGIAFRLEDDAPEVDDHRPAVCVRHPAAKRIAPAVESAMPARWRMLGAQQSRGGRAEVAFVYMVPASRGTRRRMRVVTELLRAGGWDVMRG